jgi:prepilin-type N-terminal cleavage/methylation domain-containing protein
MLRSALCTLNSAACVCISSVQAFHSRSKVRQGQTQSAHVPRDAGFTLLELLVVMGIIAMLASVSYPVITKRMENARITTAKAQISSITTALELYALDVGTFPPQQVGLVGLLQQTDRPVGSPV